MKFRFTVVGFVPPTARMAVTGGLPSLGEWSKPRMLHPLSVPSTTGASTWSALVDLSEEEILRAAAASSTAVSGAGPRTVKIEYKFVRWTSSPLNIQAKQLAITAEDEPKPPKPLCECEEVSAIPPNATSEGTGSEDNGVCVISIDVFERAARRCTAPAAAGQRRG